MSLQRQLHLTNGKWHSSKRLSNVKLKNAKTFYKREMAHSKVNRCVPQTAQHIANNINDIASVRCDDIQKHRIPSPATTRALFSFHSELASEDHDEGE
jgi:hypothetical protein